MKKLNSTIALTICEDAEPYAIFYLLPSSKSIVVSTKRGLMAKIKWKDYHKQ